MRLLNLLKYVILGIIQGITEPLPISSSGHIFILKNAFKTNIINKDKNYIFYISPTNQKYITYNFEPISQLMRIMIAKDLGFENKYNWRKEPFTSNIVSTINNLKKSI